MPIIYPWDVYAEQLVQRGRGFPLWHPEPMDDGGVLIGDVGFLYEGQFHRLFNATLSADDPVNSGGVPDGYEPFELNKNLFQRREVAVPPGVQCSRGVTSTHVTAQLNIQGAGGELHFSCTEDQAAILVLQHSASREEYRPSPAMASYMRRNYQSWYTFARDVRQEDVQEDELLFVRGWTKTSEWAAAACLEQGRESRVAFSAQFGSVAQGSFAVTHAVHSSMPWEYHSGPLPGSMATGRKGKGKGRGKERREEHIPQAQDQCVFLHFYKMKRRLRLWPTVIQGAAEPQALPSSGDHDDGDTPAMRAYIDTSVDTDCDMVVEQVPGLQKVKTPYDPIRPLLDYILHNSNAEAAVATDEDLDHLFHLGASYDVVSTLQNSQHHIATDDGVAFLIFEPNIPVNDIATEVASAGEPQNDGRETLSSVATTSSIRRQKTTVHGASPYPPAPSLAEPAQEHRGRKHRTMPFGQSPRRRKNNPASPQQLVVLNEAYARSAFPTSEERISLATQLGLSARAVQVWFQNARMSGRRRIASAQPSPSEHQPSSSGHQSIPDSSLYSARARSRSRSVTPGPMSSH